jgi:hypothetical protein
MRSLVISDAANTANVGSIITANDIIFRIIKLTF